MFMCMCYVKYTVYKLTINLLFEKYRTKLLNYKNIIELILHNQSLKRGVFIQLVSVEVVVMRRIQ